MRINLLEIYALTVCFFTVACLVIVLGVTAWNVVELTNPEFTINSRDYEGHQTDEQFSDWLVQQDKYTNHEPASYEGNKLTEARNNSWSKLVNTEKRNAKQGVVRNLIILVIDLILLIVHSLIASKARKKANKYINPDLL